MNAEIIIESTEGLHIYQFEVDRIPIALLTKIKASPKAHITWQGGLYGKSPKPVAEVIIQGLADLMIIANWLYQIDAENKEELPWEE